MNRILKNLYVAVLKYKKTIKFLKVDAGYNFVFGSDFIPTDITIEEYFSRLQK